MTALTKAAFLVALPLGAAWYLWHGHRIVAAALMAAAFAFIVGTNIRSGVKGESKKKRSTGAGEERRQIRRRAHRGPRPTANTDGRRAASGIVAIWKSCGRRLREGLNGNGAMRRYHLQAAA